MLDTEYTHEQQGTSCFIDFLTVNIDWGQCCETRCMQKLLGITGLNNIMQGSVVKRLTKILVEKLNQGMTVYQYLAILDLLTATFSHHIICYRIQQHKYEVYSGECSDQCDSYDGDMGICISIDDHWSLLITPDRSDDNNIQCCPLITFVIAPNNTDIRSIQRNVMASITIRSVQSNTATTVTAVCITTDYHWS